MSLQPHVGQPGLWTNPDWREGTPGAFAVVIGVSRYPHLDGGATPAQDLDQPWIREARRLGQLQVSAHTAHRFFSWLSEGYRYPDAPLAKCWLLLAPTGDEGRQEPDLTRHAEQPTLSACTQALKQWYTTMRALPKPAQHQSRALFFFSGHGLQVIHDKQLLLPSDYLGGDLPSWNDAISTHNLLYGLASLELPHRFFFVDACRNDFPAIREKHPEGAEILPLDVAACSYTGTRAAAVLYATAASLQAWQPTRVADGPSLYGRALLEGLQGQPDIELRSSNGSVTVGFSKLEGFVSARIVELLQQHQATVSQPVQPGGPVVRDEVVTEIPKAALQGLRPEVVSPPTRGPGETLLVPDSRSARHRGIGVERALGGVFRFSRPVGSTHQQGEWARNFGVGHGLFGSEEVTAMFSQRLQVLGLETSQWLDVDRVTLHRVDHDGEAHHFRIDLSIEDNDRVGHWLQMSDFTDTAHGVMLPGDRSARPRFLLELDMDQDDRGRRRIARFEAQLSPENQGWLGEAAGLWQRYRTADVSEAVGDFELGALERMVKEKLESPLAATVAALILLRANRLDLLHDWPRNLANWIDELPDGPVLWAEQMMREQTDSHDALSQAGEYLGLLLERGLPYTSEAFSLAASLSDRLAPRLAALPASARERLVRVTGRVKEALTYFRPGGLFTAYSNFDPEPAWLPIHRTQPEPPGGGKGLASQVPRLTSGGAGGYIGNRDG